ncbi:hypothetical protein PISMIDRAFT_686946, partial [Pisolithus microcarpus 441]
TNAKLAVFLHGLWLKGSVKIKMGEGLGQRGLVLLTKGEQGKTEKVKIVGCSEPRSNVR